MLVSPRKIAFNWVILFVRARLALILHVGRQRVVLFVGEIGRPEPFALIPDADSGRDLLLALQIDGRGTRPVEGAPVCLFLAMLLNVRC